jgi:hypothetical protein
VASPSLGGRRVAVPSSHAASSLHVMQAEYSRERGGRITQLQYLLQLSFAKFAEFLFHALR